MCTSNKRKKRKWLCTKFVINGQTKMTEFDLAFRYSMMTRKERMKAIERATEQSLLGKSALNHCYQSCKYNYYSGNKRKRTICHDNQTSPTVVLLSH